MLSCEVMSNSLGPRELEPTRLLCTWDSLSKNTGVVAIYSFRGSSRPRDQMHMSCVYYIGRQILYHCVTWEAPYVCMYIKYTYTYICV